MDELKESQKRIATLEEQVEQLKKELHEKDIECAQLDERYDEICANRDLLIQAFAKDMEKKQLEIATISGRLALYEKDGKKKNFFQRLFTF